MAAKQHPLLPEGYAVVPIRPPEEALVRARSAYSNATVYDVRDVWNRIINDLVDGCTLTHSTHLPNNEQSRYNKSGVHQLTDPLTTMSNLLLNWRFGFYHLQIGLDFPFIRIRRNQSWSVKNRPPKWFERF